MSSASLCTVTFPLACWQSIFPPFAAIMALATLLPITPSGSDGYMLQPTGGNVSVGSLRSSLAIKYSSSLHLCMIAIRFRLWNPIRHTGNRSSSTALPTLGEFCETVIALCHDGLIKEAVETLHRSKHRGLRADSRTYASLLQGCADMKLLEEGRKVHDHMIKCGFQPDIFVSNNLITMYAKCGNLKFAREVFDKMFPRDSVSWTAVISGYAQHNYGADALKLFIQMQRESMAPDKFTWVVLLQACACLADLKTGMQVHSLLIKTGSQLGVFVETALVDMYDKCGSIDCARQVFDEMSERNVVSWTTMITGYAREEKEEEALKLFCQMQWVGMKPDAFTYVSSLAICTSLLSLQFGKQVHVLILKNGFESGVWVGSALVDMYAKCGYVRDAHKVFEIMPKRNLVTWTAMITGYAQNEHALESLALFYKFQQAGMSPNQFTFASVLGACTRAENLNQGKQIHAHIIKSGFEVDVHVGSTVVDMYAKCGSTEDASKAFQRIPERDLVLWTAMVTGYARNWEGELALKTFCLMQQVGMKPNQFTFSSIIGACTCLTALEQGKQIHCTVVKSGYESDVCVGSTLIDMYAKCGSIEDAQRVFDKMGVRNVISWTAMIVGYAQHGFGEEALQLFEQMQSIGMKPDHITFVGVLSACSNAGLVDRGRQFFVSMSRDYGVTPEIEHYVCMVDLFGRAGYLDDAERFIRDMVFEPDALVWQTLLSACRIHGNLELGKHVVGCLFVSEPEKVQTYVLLSNIYAACGKWEDVAKVRRLMKDRRLKKEPGASWIDVNNRVHVFVVDDG